MITKSLLLRKELEDAGSSPSESRQLCDIALQLRELNEEKGITLSLIATQVRQLGIQLSLALSCSVAILLSAILLSQSTLPGDFLYPVKRASEKAIVLVNPHYAGHAMVRRSQEVAYLISVHSPQPLVLQTLHDYSIDAMHYAPKDPKDTALLQQSKQNLTLARYHATPSVRHAIDLNLELKSV